MSLSLFRTTPVVTATPQTCTRPNYFFGAPASDQPSQKVVVADKLAVSCGIDTDTNKTLLPPGAEPGQVIFENQALKWGVTTVGTSGDILASGGGGSSPPYWDSLSCQTGNLVVTNLEIEGDLTLNALLPNGVLLGGAAALVTTNAGFLWTDVTQNLQLGTRGVSIGVGAGITTNGVAIGNVAGQSGQLAFSVAIGDGAGRLTQQMSSVAIGNTAGGLTQGLTSVAVGNNTGNFSQGSTAVAMGLNAAQTRQGNSAVAIGNRAGQTFQASAIAIGNSAGAQSQLTSSVAIGLQAGQTAQNTQTVAIGTMAGSQTQATTCVSIGNGAGQTSQQSGAVAIGTSAGAFSQAASAVAIGEGAGQYTQASGFYAIGYFAGNTGQLGPVAIGTRAGEISKQALSVAIGNLAGQFSQGSTAVTLGNQAGQTSQGSFCVTIGNLAGNVSQTTEAVAIGNQAGQTSQGNSGVAIGNQAGQTFQGNFAVAIGNLAGQSTQITTSICLNASGVVLNPTTAGFYASPIRSVAAGAGTTVLSWVAASTEIINNTTKTFVIPDPLSPDLNLLVHSCVEGPQVGVYYRGKGVIHQGTTKAHISLPEYAASLASNWIIHISPHQCFPKLTRSQVEKGTFSVSSQFPAVTDLSFSWIAYGIRKDPTAALNVEPMKTQQILQGKGPYQWLI